MASRRRKGERPIDKSQFYRPYDSSHAVAHAIRTGSRWFLAWQFQYGFSDARLVKQTSIAPDRLRQLDHGAPVLSAEIEALAAAYGVQPSDIIASLPDPALLLEG
ncbi:hypothetical protein [Sphingobium yanoikuyae]|uniref:XRE family transcriptional regulator n=1 Tax=Sphingobium yanoikuyae TaxID=13690 RepID=A0A430BWX9_SPHYA|nr:hypothetical protein [Sphingobium yanoikuyae]RSU57232.1 hypothetical protein DAH51_10490 [Sphingobium yanoikuyae]